MGRRSIHFVYACALLVATATSAVRAQTPEDTAMAQQVAGSIKSSGQLSNYRLGVKYQDGVAWLLGSVSSVEQEQKAIELASTVAGVDQVISKLEIAGQSETLVSPEAEVAKAAPATEQNFELASTETMSQPVAQPRMAQSPVMQRPMMQRPMGQQMPRPMSPQQASAIRAAGGPMGPQGGPMPASYCGPCQGGGGMGMGMGGGMGPQPSGYVPGGGGGPSYDNANMPNYAWPSYAAYPNYAAVTYPKQYSPTAWPYIGPFYPYPQVPLGWRKVTLEWDDGWWNLDFSHAKTQ
ncbi:BON domain-containing protein [Aeoliella sp. SH292]|uniref:BON domain-containing protein n=1 Tax=Aeoliella sp. SH292 TaxID=3454464 RepID=UPI003F972293